MKVKCRKGNRTEVIDSNANSLYEIVSYLRSKGKIVIATDYDKGIAILNDGSVIEDIAQHKKFKELMKYV